MNISKIIKEEMRSFDWAVKIEPYEIGDYFIDWDGQKCWISDITDDEIEIGTYDDNEDEPSYYPYKKDEIDQYFKSGELKVIKEDFDWAKQVVDEMPSEGDVYIVPKAFYNGNISLPKGKITVNSVNNTPHHGILALVTIYDELVNHKRSGTSIRIKDIMDSLESGYLIKEN